MSFILTKSLIHARHILCCSVLSFFSVCLFSQPVNDNCANAITITIPNGGFGFGIFASITNDLSAATVQTGETFAPAILVAGQNQKSIWYKFTLPTTRSVRVSLAQPGSAITAGDAGFAVYKTSTCLPTNADISIKLTPIGIFGATFHPCVEPGVYLVQVSGKAAANGPVYINVELAAPTALYDLPANAYQFGTLAAPNFTKYVDYAVDCHTIDSTSEVCPALSNYQQYTKSAWHTFTTPAYFDYVAVLLSGTGSTSYFTNSTTYEKFGYNLYLGNAGTSPLSSLILVDGCDSLQSNGYYPDRKVYSCSELQPNTTYTIQLFFHQNFNNNVRVAVTFDGTAPTQAPEAVLSLVPPSNKLGVLPSSATGITTTVTDQLACNSRHSLRPCNPALPGGGIRRNGLNYNLSTFFTFTISSTSRISISGGDYSPPYRYYSTPLLMRLYAQDLTNTCSSLDTNNLAAPPFLSNSGFSLDCVSPGTYTLQVSGRDTLSPLTNYYYGYLTTANYVLSMLSDLGKKFNLSITVSKRNASNKYDLEIPGAFDTIHAVSGVMQPLVNGVNYPSRIDTFGCANTVLPWDTACLPSNTKAMYREFIVPDSGVVYLTGYLWTKLYKGDADALATAQNVHTYPSRIAGLIPYTNCLWYTNECSGNPGTKVCVVPGTYTHVSFGDNSNIGQAIQPSYTFRVLNTVHDSPLNAENIGILNPGVNTLVSSLDYFSCKDNAVPINGYQPCTISGQPATKAIYRQFYLNAPATITVSDISGNFCNVGIMTVFAGKISNGVAGLTALAAPFRCFQNATSNGTCVVLDTGWYSIVSYGSGPSYANPFQNLNQYTYGSHVGYPNQVTITAQVACPGPKFNRPYKAAIDTLTHLPYLIQWGPRVGHTAAIPKTDTTYTLYQENFNCTVDTPFASHPIPNCNASLTKVAYYVFRTTQESFMQIDTKGFWAAVYQGNAKTDSSSFGAITLIQPCIQSSGYIQLCKLQPGDYTLAVFASSTQNCNSVIPTIYIDQVGYSRFDHANNAYDFGTIPPDSIYHFGKLNDVNPLDANRSPSNDFFYCTTGSQQTDPTDAACGTDFNSQIYNTGVNNDLYNGTANATPNPYSIARRNLWYTFVVDKGGYVRVRVYNRTIGKGYQYPFAIYKSNADGTLPFSTLVSSGQVDSTIAQGLTFVGQNASYGVGYCSNRYNEFSFYREPCSSVPERYYLVVFNSNSYPYEYPAMKPNSQTEVAILLDSVNAIQPRFDHYSLASNIGSNLGAGTYNGATDNYSCATRDTPDPIWGYTPATCSKTLWYKFSTTVTGYIRFRAIINGLGQYNYDPYHIQLFRQIIPGDSSVNGLQILNAGSPSVYDPAITGYWGQTCISPGTYYIILPGCAQINEYTYPQIQIFEQAGDFCSVPVMANLNGPGTNVSSVVVDCHTIGTDYGEFNPTLTCPAGVQTNQYKSSWFRINISPPDTLDVTTYLTENTNATSIDIKYRLMNGNCGAMQERSCVQDALTQDTYKCLAPGSYWVQVFTPVVKNGVAVTGTINLNLSAVHHADTCAPIPPCLANANFQPQLNCASDDRVTFVNYSTFGSAVSYNWNFGYNGQTSTAVSPQFNYPALAAAQTYTVTLTVTNSSCTQGGGTVVYSAPITIPGRPNVNLGNDTIICNTGSSLLLNAATWTGSTYQWQNGSISPTFNATTTGTFWVNVTYNGCVKRDTIVIRINPITRLLQTKYLCGNDSVLLNSVRNQGETYLWNTGETSASVYAKTAGIYINTLTWNGCTIRDTFNVLNAVQPFAHTDTTICFPFHVFSLSAATPGAVSYLWQNNSAASTYSVTAPGTYWVQVWNGSCYKRDTVTVLVSAAPVINNTNASICAGQTYTLPWGTIVSTANTYRDTLRYSTGCDSVRRTVILTVKPNSSSTTNAAICPDQLPYSWNGNNYNAGGSYVYHTLNAVGCDSAATLNLTVKSNSSSTTNAAVCSNQLPYNWNGNNYNASGVYVYHTTNAVACDSAATLNLTVKSTSSSTTNTIICSNQLPYSWNGNNYNASGSYVYHTLNAVNCDSAATLNLTVKSTSSSTTNTAICPDQLPYSWNGNNYNASGAYVYHTLNAVGCDSAATLNLTVKSTSSSATNTTICSNQLPYNWNGNNYNASGSYVYHALNAVGCDSAATLNLTVKLTSSSTTNTTICSNQLPYSWNGNNYTASGAYLYHTLNAAGCDSAATLNLTVKSTSSSTTNTIICSDQLPYSWNGNNYNAAGTYLYHTLNAAGCDSAATLNLTVKSTSSSTTNTIICSDQSPYSRNGNNYNASGAYLYHTLNAAGCDSAATLNLTVKSISSSTTNTTICSNQLPYSWNGNNYNASGAYVYHTFNAVGCDSAATLNLTVKSTSSSITNTTICSNQLPYNWNGNNYNAAGNYVYHTLNAVGCDSAATLNLTVKLTSNSTTNAAICSDQLPYSWNGNNYTASGSYVYHTLNAVGCDSAATLNLTVKSTSSSITSRIICVNQLPYSWNGNNYTGAGIYLANLVNAAGCDSAATLNLTVQSSLLQTTNPVICAGQSYTLPWGAAVNISGVYRDTLHYITTGCDSIRRIVNLIVQSPVSQVTEPVICQGATYTLPWGEVVNTAGTYRDTLHYMTGCDSVRRIVNLQVTAAVVAITNATICSDETYTLPWGAVINIAGMYKDTVRTLVGCDSLIRTVNLAVDLAPSVIMSKSNDVNCMLSVANLRANGGVSYTWTPAASLNNATVYNPAASPSATTWYKVLVTSDKGCTTEDSIQVKVIAGDTGNGYLVPNAFTPNGDGKNDCFGVQTWGAVTEFQFSIYNRWGQRIFYTTKPSDCWDGRYKGAEQNPDVYVYQITAKGLCGSIYRKGTFTLIR